jgi:hypothetical protein
MSGLDTQPAKAVTVGAPHMRPEEVAAVERFMRSGVSRYMEFGMGGSTLLAARCGIETIIAVDSDIAWVTSIRNHPEIEPLVRQGSAAILHADIGPIGAFGAPTSREFLSRWINYIKAPWAECETRNVQPQLVLVDGRFRVASCLSVFIAWHLAAIGTPAPTILLHDFVPERPSYDRVNEFFDQVDAVQTLRVLRPKIAASPLLAFTTFMEVMYDGA